MNIKVTGWLKQALVISLGLSFFSCKNTFDIAPEDALEYKQAYQNVYDADAAVMGVYGKFMGLAERYMVLNELRADLEDVTNNADQYLQQINNHTVTEGNPWADPRPFYDLIINCNDALKNFDIMLQNKRLSQTDYNIRYSEIGAIRSWAYLQLGIHYGAVPYITQAVDKVEDLKDLNSYPKVPFDRLVDTLITFTKGLPNIDPIPAGTTLLTTLDTYNTTKMFVNKYCLLGDLYLWDNNWPEAAFYYHKVMEYADVLYPNLVDAGENWFNTYRLGNSNTRLSGANWFVIFGASFGERYSNYEIIWNLPFDKRFSPVNPFFKLYSPFSGQYLIKPSALAISNWTKETRSDASPGDVNRAQGTSYSLAGGANYPEIYKLYLGYDRANPFETTGKWILYRAAMLHLRMSEAANRDGRDRLAYALMNNGIRAAYTPRIVPANVTNIMQSLDSNPSYYFDARFGEFPRFRAAWINNEGVRGRAGLAPATVDSTKYFDMSVPGNENKALLDRAGLTVAMEDLIIKEAALELAFEGNRWQDLLRIALRRKNSDPNYLANKIAAKFEAKGRVDLANAVRAKLSNPNNWYLPFK